MFKRLLRGCVVLLFSAVTLWAGDSAAHLEGTSLKPLFDKPDRRWRSAAFSQYPRPNEAKPACMGHSLTDGRYRFTRWRWKDGSKPDEFELYDHKSDPQENVNLASSAAAKRTVERMTAMLDAGWRAAVPK